MLIDVWVVYEGGDDRSHGSPAYFFSSEGDANAKTKGSGWYGGDAHVEKRKAVAVQGRPGHRDIPNDPVTYYLVDEVGEIDLDGEKEALRSKLRKQAKAKLSQEELDALGVTED